MPSTYDNSDNGALNTDAGPISSFSLGYRGRFEEVARIALRNGLLNVVTIGFYRFWGRTRLRRYLWGHVDVAGEPLEYTGTGKELLLGFLVAASIIFIFYGGLGGLTVWKIPEAEFRIVINVLGSIIFLFLYNAAIYSARRYRLSRTQWRGIRGAQTGSAFRYAAVAFVWTAVSVLSLGLCVPFQRIYLQRVRTSNTWFGTERFSFHGKAREMFGTWFIAWLLLIPTVGLSYYWYRVREFRYVAQVTRFGSLRFASALKTPQVVGIGVKFVLAAIAALIVSITVAFILSSVLTVGMMLFGSFALTMGNSVIETESSGLFSVMPLLVLITLFVAIGVVRTVFLVHPLAKAIVSSTKIVGEIDIATIRQTLDSGPRRGEGLVEVLNVGEF